ncbi:MAG: hypothetical protein R2771_09250 [Saprospiraceae bacterium]
MISYDEIKDWMPKTWELKSEEGISMERYISASGIQQLYSKNSGIDMDKLIKNNIFPLDILHEAIEGEVNAINTMTEVAKNMALVIVEKISTLYFGWQNSLGFFDFQKKIEKANHRFLKTKFDKIIIGQRIGDLFKESIGTGILLDQLYDYIYLLINELESSDFKNHYLEKDKFNSELIKFSRLREAPALGAAIDAYHKNRRFY